MGGAEEACYERDRHPPWAGGSARELHQMKIAINSSSFLGLSRPTEHEGVRNITITSVKNVPVRQSSIFGNWEVILSEGWYS